MWTHAINNLIGHNFLCCWMFIVWSFCRVCISCVKIFWLASTVKFFNSEICQSSVTRALNLKHDGHMTPRPTDYFWWDAHGCGSFDCKIMASILASILCNLRDKSLTSAKQKANQVIHSTCSSCMYSCIELWFAVLHSFCVQLSSACCICITLPTV